MPTLFTALQTHLPSAVVAPLKVPTPSLAAEVLGTSAGATQTATKRERKRPRTPHPRLSLRQRFRIKPLKTPRHIVVIGSGFAGLAAAYELKSVGYRVTVLEGRHEVGGRVSSSRNVVPGRVVERGAELIGLNHLAWWSYARKFKLPLKHVYESDSPSPVVLGGRLLSPARADLLAQEMARGEKLFNDAARRVNADEPWRTFRAARLDRMSLATGLKSLRMSRLCRLAFTEQLESDNGVAATEQSWLANLAMIRGGGLTRYWRDTETHHCPKGNQALAFRLQHAVGRVQTGKRVTRIEIGPTGVVVHSTRGRPVAADDVILAIPPTMWRRSLRITPPLPKSYAVQFGKNVKYILNVENGCWDPESPVMTSDGPIDVTWLGTAFDRKKARAGWVAFSGAADAVKIRRWGTRRRREILKRLCAIYPRTDYRAGAGQFMDWLTDPWTHGSYSFPKPGQVTRVGPLLHQSFRNHLYFAGEHTCYAFTGYMEGALRSGLRVAEQIARRDGVI